MIRAGVAEALAKRFGVAPSDVTFRRVGGGCINAAAIATVDDREVFVKWNDHDAPGQFAAEAAGLRALHDAGSGLVVPAPIASSDEGPGRSFLALEYLPPGRKRADFDEALGRGLAALHRASSPKGFGFEVDGYCGATPQPNGWMETWLEFYRERRLGHQLALATRRGLSAGDARAVEGAIASLERHVVDDEPPALIHGDLWSGNLHVGPDGDPGLIDPAAYYGHREAELGMMSLFGGFSERVYAAYDEARPLREGWRDRLGLYALYHVLNHFVLFGGGYGSQAGQLARRYAR